MMEHEHEIKPNAVYTTKEAQALLKISNSTLKRMFKKRIIRANKIGGQYRLLGRELLRVIFPVVERKTIRWYLRIKDSINNKIKEW